MTAAAEPTRYPSRPLQERCGVPGCWCAPAPLAEALEELAEAFQKNVHDQAYEKYLASAREAPTVLPPRRVMSSEGELGTVGLTEKVKFG